MNMWLISFILLIVYLSTGVILAVAVDDDPVVVLADLSTIGILLVFVWPIVIIGMVVIYWLNLLLKVGNKFKEIIKDEEFMLLFKPHVEEDEEE